MDTENMLKDLDLFVPMPFDQKEWEQQIDDASAVSAGNRARFAAIKTYLFSAVVPAVTTYNYALDSARDLLSRMKEMREARKAEVPPLIESTQQKLDDLENEADRIVKAFNIAVDSCGVQSASPSVHDFDVAVTRKIAARGMLSIDAEQYVSEPQQLPAEYEVQEAEDASPTKTRKPLSLFDIIIGGAIGVLLGIAVDIAFGFMKLRDLRTGLTPFQGAIAFILGPILIIAVGQLIYKVFGNLVRMNRDTPPQERFLVYFGLVLTGLIWLSEMTVEAYGFYEMNLQQVKINKDVLGHQDAVPLPPWIIFTLGFFAGAVYFGYKIYQSVDAAKSDVEKAEKKRREADERAKIRNEHLKLAKDIDAFISSEPQAREARVLARQHDSLDVQIQKLRQELASLEAELERLQDPVVLSPDKLTDLRRKYDIAERRMKDLTYIINHPDEYTAHVTIGDTAA